MVRPNQIYREISKFGASGKANFNRNLQLGGESSFNFSCMWSMLVCSLYFLFIAVIRNVKV